MAALHVEIIPFAQTNYAYLIMDSSSEECAVIDPGDASTVAYAVAKSKRRLTRIFNTHHHADHTGGNLTLKNAYGAQVYASNYRELPGVDYPLRDGSHFEIFGHMMQVMETPGHTMDALCFLIEGHLFTGDTLFAMGCGKLFEGSPRTMQDSLDKILSLPDTTLIYPGHEYTHTDARFAQTIEPDNQVIHNRLMTKPTVPFTLALEKASNPFLRTSVAGLRANLHLENAKAYEVLADLRQRKDRF